MAITIADIRSIADALPGAYEQPSYGDRPSWRTKARMFTWVREDPEAPVVWVDSVEEQQMLVESEPEKFFVTDHYVGHPIVLVHLDNVDVTEATELITESFRQRAPKGLVAQLPSGPE